MVLIDASMNCVFQLGLSICIVVYLGIKGFLSDGRRGQIKVMFCTLLIFCLLWGTFQEL